MKLGLALPHYDFSFPDHQPVSVARVVDYARRAEDAGFDSVWVSDHLFLDISRYGAPAGRARTPEAFAMMSAIAAATERVRFGSLVLCAPFRNPTVMALQAASLFEVSGGRLDVGLGAGWYQAEFDEAGIPFGTTGERIDILKEAAKRLRGSVPTFVGSKGGPRMARVVAEHADGWNTVWRVTPEDYAARANALKQACERAGRDPASVRMTVGLYAVLGSDQDDLARRYRDLQAWMPGGALDAMDLATFARDGLAGTPEQCALRLKAFEEAGAQEMILSLGGLPFSVYDDDQIELAMRMVR